MSQATSGPPFDRSPDQEYFRAIEQAFVLLRGSPFQMSPDDFGVAREWRRQGVPTDLIAEVLAEVIAKRRRDDTEIPLRLAYYRRAVGARWKDRRRLQAPADALAMPTLDLADRIDRLAGLVAAQAWPGDSVARQIRATAELGSDIDAIEAALASIERRVLDAAAERLDADARRALKDQLDRALEQLAQRLPGGASEAATTRLRDELLRRQAGVPVLSVFSLDAVGSVDHGRVGDAEQDFP